jgi:hypothetical protein
LLLPAAACQEHTLAAKGTASRRPPPAANGARAMEDVPLPGGGVPVIRLTPADEGERVTLFYIGDREFTITARPQAEVGLRFLKLSQTPVSEGGGEQAAIYYLLTKLLGQDGYDALMGFDGLQQSQFQQIVRIASELALGAVEPPK